MTHIENITKRCVDRLSVRRKITFYKTDDKNINTDYHRGLMDGKKITEEACYFFFTYSYNLHVKEEIKTLVKNITEYYEKIIEIKNKQYKSKNIQ